MPLTQHEIRAIESLLQGTPRQGTAGQFRRTLRPLFEEQTPRLRDRTVAELRAFFCAYRASGTEQRGVERFLTDLSNLLRQMADSPGIPLASLHADPDRQRGNRAVFESDVVQRIDIIYGGQSFRRQYRQIIEACAEHIQPRRAVAAARQQTREQNWHEYWSLFFTETTFQHPTVPGVMVTGNLNLGPNGGVARLARWTLEKWDQFVEHARPLGFEAARLRLTNAPGWEARRNEQWQRSLWVLDADPTHRPHGETAGIRYFSDLYTGYVNAVVQIFSDALGLEDAVRRGRRERATESRMEHNLPIWTNEHFPASGGLEESLMDALTPPNQTLVRNIAAGWRQYWQRGNSVGSGAALRAVGIDIATSGGLGSILEIERLRPY